MSLEAVLHLSGVPSYVVSLLVMLQMQLLLVEVPEVRRAHTQRFAQLQAVTVPPHVTWVITSPAPTLVAFKKRSGFLSPCSFDSSVRG